MDDVQSEDPTEIREVGRIAPETKVPEEVEERLEQDDDDGEEPAGD